MKKTFVSAVGLAIALIAAPDCFGQQGSNIPVFESDRVSPPRRASFDGGSLGTTFEDSNNDGSSFFPKLPSLNLSMPKLDLTLPKLTMPKLQLPKFSLLPRKKPGQPSTMQKINGHWSNFLSKSKTTLMPWTASQPTGPDARFGSTSARQAANTPERKPFYQAFFGGEGDSAQRKPSGTPQTVNEFLQLPRPKY